jgi:hypothetical protein
VYVEELDNKIQAIKDEYLEIVNLTMDNNG